MSTDSPQGERARARPAVILLGHIALLAAFALAFHRDVRARDAFSWMDPYQYYDFARAVLSGAERFGDFEVASVFPFLLMPALSISPSIPSVLWTNVALTVALMACLHLLCRVLELRTPSPVIALLVLSSPLLIGLSRTIYVEYALTLTVALAFLLLLGLLERDDGFEGEPSALGVAFACVVCFGVMLKMTFPLFLALPVAAALAQRLAVGRMRDVRWILTLTVLPALVALALQAAFFSRSFGYYLSLGNTSVPVMRLIGPPDMLSFESASFYFVQLGRTLLFGLVPFLLLAAVFGLRRVNRASWASLAGRRSLLWLWLLGPLLLLILQPVKEPRHVAPCVVPAVLLLVQAVEQVRGRALRRALLGVASATALVQAALVLGGRLDTPYYWTGALEWPSILERMGAPASGPFDPGSPQAARHLLWRYDQNIALSGFEANEALALTWQAFPGVVYDLETLADPERLSDEIPYARFEDLYVLTAFNDYNRRCGWHHYYRTLDEAVVVKDADFVLVAGSSPEEAARAFPGHVLAGSVPREKGDVQVLRARNARTTPYRLSYAEAFLERNASLDPAEASVVAREMLQAAVLGRDDGRARAILSRHPELADPDFVARNIYWIAGYEVVRERTSIEMPRGVVR